MTEAKTMMTGNTSYTGVQCIPGPPKKANLGVIEPLYLFLFPSYTDEIILLFSLSHPFMGVLGWGFWGRGFGPKTAVAL